MEALSYLQTRFRLVILSNVDRASFQATSRRLGVVFDAVHTAQDIGSYNPDPLNFAYVQERLAANRVTRSEVLHVAQSLFHDHVPAKAAGFATAWIDRRRAVSGWGATAPVNGAEWQDVSFTSMAALVEAPRASG